MTVAVVFALIAEWAPWRSRHVFRSVSLAGATVYEASIAQSLARVAISGVGAPRASQVVDALTTRPVDAVIAVGLAGALRGPSVCGDVIVARQIRSATSGLIIAADPWLVEAAAQCGAKIVDVLVSTDRVAGTIDEKRRLSTQGEAVDMESFKILDEARRRGIPAVAIRVIGDEAAEPLPLDFDRAVRADGSVNVMNLVAQALRAPSRWPALLSFGYRQHRAVRTLAGFLDRFVSALGASVE